MAGGGIAVARVEGYRFGRVLVDGEEHTRDLIVLPYKVVPGWWRRDGHRLALEDLEGVLDELPETLVIGTGEAGRMQPDPGTVKELEERGIAVEALPTPAAIRRYSELAPERAALAAHLTC
jgi:hypothetical protein